MKIEDSFKTLGIPLLLVGVIVALLALAGLTLDQLYVVVAALVGLQLFGALLIDVLKYTGVIKAGKSGVWSAGFQLIALVCVAVWIKFYPTFDIYAADQQLFELAKILGLLFAYMTQVLGAKAVHQVAASKGIGYSFPLF